MGFALEVFSRVLARSSTIEIAPKAQPSKRKENFATNFRSSSEFDPIFDNVYVSQNFGLN